MPGKQRARKERAPQLKDAEQLRQAKEILCSNLSFMWQSCGGKALQKMNIDEKYTALEASDQNRHV